MSVASDSGPSFDFTSLDELDPSLSNGFRILYEREVPLEVRNQNGDGRQGGTLELIKVKILTVGSDDAPTAIRLEMSSEVDLFFHYQHFVDERVFSKIQEAQKLMVDLSDYPTILVRMLNACIKEPHINLGIFTMLSDSEARLDFIQNMEYKFVELMYCVCVRSPEETVQQHITFRYNSMKQRLTIMQSRLQEINNLVKIKNPSLLLQLQKTSSLPTPNSVGASPYGTNAGAYSHNNFTSLSVGSTTSSQGPVHHGNTSFAKPFR